MLVLYQGYENLEILENPIGLLWFIDNTSHKLFRKITLYPQFREVRGWNNSKILYKNKKKRIFRLVHWNMFHDLLSVLTPIELKSKITITLPGMRKIVVLMPLPTPLLHKNDYFFIWNFMLFKNVLFILYIWAELALVLFWRFNFKTYFHLLKKAFFIIIIIFVLYLRLWT